MGTPVPHQDQSGNLETRRPRRGVIGIMVKEDRLLVIRRAEGIAKGGTWCFPGGHIEAGERPKTAIIREVREELGITIRPVTRLGSLRVMDSKHVLVAWRIEHVEGDFKPDPREIADYSWLTPKEIRDIRPTLPSNEVVLRMLDV